MYRVNWAVSREDYPKTIKNPNVFGLIRRISNPSVAGSNPAGGAKKIRGSGEFEGFSMLQSQPDGVDLPTSGFGSA